MFKTLLSILNPNLHPSDKLDEMEQIDMDIQLNLGDDDDDDVESLLYRKVESSSAMQDLSKAMGQQNQVFVVDAIKEYFQCLSAWCRIAPITITHSKCDVLKFIDDFLAVVSQDNGAALPSTMMSSVAAVTIDLLELICFFDEKKMCSWFGNEDEAGKLLNAILVNDNWRASTKKTTLCKIFLLANLTNDPSVKKHASDFKMQVLLRSGLFGETPYDNIELVHEAAGWVYFCEDTDSILVLETLLRLSFHFAPSVGSFIHKKGLVGVDSFCSSLMQVVLMLCSGNMAPFCDILPKFIQSYIQALCNKDDSATSEGQKTHGQGITFFDKFNRGFRAEIETLAITVFTHTLPIGRNFSTSCNLFAQFSIFRSFFPTSKVLDVILKLSTTTIDVKGRSKEVTNSDLIGDYSSTLDYCVHNFKQLISSTDDKQQKLSKEKLPKNKENLIMGKELLCFVDKNWKILALRTLNGSKLSAIPNNFFGWLEIQCKYDKLEDHHPWDLSGTFMFCLNSLALLNDHLSRGVKCESDLEKTKCSNCLVLADFLGELTLKLLEKTISHIETVSQILECSLLQFNIGCDHAFGMLSRNVVSIILESNYTLHINPRHLYQKLDRIAKMLTDKVVIKSAMLDPSFFRLLSAVSKLIEDYDASSEIFQPLVRIYCNLKIVLTPVLSNGLPETNNNVSGFVRCADPVYRIGEFSPLGEFDTLLQSIKNKGSRANSFSPFLMPSLKELKNGSWSFFDFFAIASSKSDYVWSARLADRQLHCLTTTKSIKPLTSCVFIGTGSIGNDFLEEYSRLLKDELKELDVNKTVEVVEILIRNFDGNDKWVAVTSSFVNHLKEDLSLSSNRLSLCLLLEGLANGGWQLMNGGLIMQLIISLKQGASTKQVSWKQEFMTEVLDLCIHHCKVQFESSSPNHQFSYITRIIDFVKSIASCSNIHESSVWASIDKWIKFCLWSRLADDEVMSAFQRLMTNLYNTECRMEILPPMESSLNPLKMLRLLVTHQSIGEILAVVQDTEPSAINSSESTHRNEKNKPRIPTLLRLILSLVKIIGNHSFEVKPLLATFQKLQKLLLLHYKGTFSESDRITYRLLSILFEKYKVGIPLCRIKPVFAVASSNSGDSWLYQYIKPPTVYNTLANFPLWRSLLPQPFAWEPDFCQEAASYTDKSLKFKEKLSDNHRHADFLVDSPLAFIDFNFASTSLQYDPAYLLLITLSSLQRYDVSIRQLTNCGGVSIVIASLAANCAIVRTYAVACLSIIWRLTNEQDAEKDPSFRERPQILHLLGFLRNSIEQSTMNINGSRAAKDKAQQQPTRKSISQLDTDGSIFKLPLTTSVFLAKAALQMMQPKHELYIPINLYLIGRPICDVRDVPLFDLLVQNADSETEQSERLSVLRSLRDGLRTHQDHLNLCRKHAYSKLMLLFPVFASDHRAGHAVFDIFDNACRHREPTRYLLEKCNFAVWLQKFIFVPTTSKRSVAESSNAAVFATHAVTNLRRTLSALFLINREGISFGHEDCFTTVNLFVTTALLHIDAVIQDKDYLASLLLLCWESSLIQRHINVASDDQRRQMFDWVSMQDFAFALYESCCLKRANYEYFGTIAILIAYAGSMCGLSHRGTPLLNSFSKDMIHFLVTGSSTLSGKEKMRSTYLMTSSLSSLDESGVAIQEVDLMHLSTVALVETIEKDEYVLPRGLPYSERMELAWNVLSHHDFTTSDPLPDTLGMPFVCMHFAIFLMKQLSSNNTALIDAARDNCIVWCLTVWNLYFSRLSDQCCMELSSRCFVAGEFRCSYASVMKLLVPCETKSDLPDHSEITISFLKHIVDIVGSLTLQRNNWTAKFPHLSSLFRALSNYIPSTDNYTKYVTACQAGLRWSQIAASLESKCGSELGTENLDYVGNSVHLFQLAVQSLPNAHKLDQMDSSPAEELLKLFEQRGFIANQEKVSENDGRSNFGANAKTIRKLKRTRDASQSDNQEEVRYPEGYIRLKKVRRTWQPLSRLPLRL